MCDLLGLLRLFDKKGQGTVSFDALVNGLVGMLRGFNLDPRLNKLL